MNTINFEKLRISLKSYEGGYKVMLIWMAEKGRPLTITKEYVNLTHFIFPVIFETEHVVHDP